MDWVEKLLVEYRDVLHAIVGAVNATVEFVHGPLKLTTRALLAEITRKRSDVKKSNQRKELADTILKRGARETPLMVSFECKASFSTTGSALLINGKSHYFSSC